MSGVDAICYGGPLDGQKLNIEPGRDFQWSNGAGEARYQVVKLAGHVRRGDAAGWSCEYAYVCVLDGEKIDVERAMGDAYMQGTLRTEEARA